MAQTNNKKRKLSNFELSPAARGAIKRIQAAKGWTKTLVVETAVAILENSLTDAQATQGTK